MSIPLAKLQTKYWQSLKKFREEIENPFALKNDLT